nr:hypothetical protein Iba_chr14fCG2890 [Ipomoea batatas]
MWENMLGKQLIHLEHVSAVRFKDYAQGIITDDLSFVSGILKVVFPDVCPQALHDLSSRQCWLTNDSLKFRRYTTDFVQSTRSSSPFGPSSSTFFRSLSGILNYTLSSCEPNNRRRRSLRLQNRRLELLWRRRDGAVLVVLLVQGKMGIEMFWLGGWELLVVQEGKMVS